MAGNLSGNCWEMVSGNPAAQEILKVLIREDRCREDYCELAEMALALAAD